MRYEVPFISQYEDIADPDWQYRGCGVVALKMVLDYWHSLDERNRTARLKELHKTCLDAGAYYEGIGWSHGGLAGVAQQLGYEAYNRDWALNGPSPKTVDAAWEALLLELERGPVLASVYSGMEPSRGGGHIVVVTGTEDELVLFSDPEQQSEREGERALAHSVFLNAFKHRYIVVRPRNFL